MKPDDGYRAAQQQVVAEEEDHIGQNYDEPLAERDAVIPFADGRVQRTQIVTEIDVKEPRTDVLQATSGRLRLRLSEYPVFLEPADR